MEKKRSTVFEAGDIFGDMFRIVRCTEEKKEGDISQHFAFCFFCPGGKEHVRLYSGEVENLITSVSKFTSLIPTDKEIEEASIEFTKKFKAAGDMQSALANAFRYGIKYMVERISRDDKEES